MKEDTLYGRAVWAYRRRASRLLHRHPFTIEPGAPLVSFTFDDFPRSALLTGGAILEHHGLTATYYLSLGLAGRITETGLMFERADLSRALDAGHELGCHTYDHLPAWNTPADRFEASVRRNADALAGIVDARCATLSYPIEQPRPETKRRMSRYFNCCRGGGQRHNAGTVDRNCLNALFLEQCGGRREPIREEIDAACRAGGWLILATHDVADAPTRFGCTTTFFAQIVQMVVDSGATVLPVNAAWRELQRRSVR